MSCDRFDVARWDRGEPPDEHERACPDCQAERAAYQRLALHLKALPRIEPPPGWEGRVRTARPAWPWLLAAAAVLLLVGFLLTRGREEALAIQQDVITSGGTRADNAAVGDRLSIRARGSELRVYRDDALVLRCPGDSRCKDGPWVELVLDARGSYRVVIFGPGAPAPAGSLDDDARRAREAKVRFQLGAPLRVE